MNDLGMRRLLAELEDTGHEDCARPGCTYPAVLGGLCGFHRGADLASRGGSLPGWKPESERPRTTNWRVNG